MPQDVEFRIPFPARISQDADRARERGLWWVRQRGLVPGPVDERRFLSWDIAGLMARWAPLATGAALDLVVDATNALTLMDDQFDGPLAGRPGEVARVCATFRDIVCADVPGTIPAGAGPLARAWVEAWARVCAGRSAYWRAREAAGWCWYLESIVDETRDRAAGAAPTPAVYLARRRKSGIVYPMLGLTEAAYGLEVTRRPDALPEVRRMREIASDVICTTNDVFSLEKEESRGDQENLVLVLERERGGPRAARVADAVGLVERRCAEFVEIEHRLGDVCVAAHLTAAETLSVWRLADIARSAMRGQLDWYAETGRYSSLVPAGEPAYANLL